MPLVFRNLAKLSKIRETLAKEEALLQTLIASAQQVKGPILKNNAIFAIANLAEHPQIRETLAKKKRYFKLYRLCTTSKRPYSKKQRHFRYRKFGNCSKSSTTSNSYRLCTSRRPYSKKRCHFSYSKFSTAQVIAQALFKLSRLCKTSKRPYSKKQRHFRYSKFGKAPLKLEKRLPKKKSYFKLFIASAQVEDPILKKGAIFAIANLAQLPQVIETIAANQALLQILRDSAQVKDPILKKGAILAIANLTEHSKITETLAANQVPLQKLLQTLLPLHK